MKSFILVFSFILTFVLLLVLMPVIKNISDIIFVQGILAAILVGTVQVVRLVINKLIP